MHVLDRADLRLVTVTSGSALARNAYGRSRASRRDDALDILRGWFIVMMVMSHIGGLTRVSALAHLPLYLSAAYGFVLLSGVVLGLASRRRLDREDAWPTYSHIWRRAGGLWALHCALTLIVLLIHETTGRLPDERWVADLGGWVHVAWLVPTLQLQPLDYMNILPMYVLFVGIAPIVLAIIRRGWSGLVVAASVSLYAAAQFYPELMRVSSPISGQMHFAPAAWQLLFFGGLVFGYHAADGQYRCPTWRKRGLIFSGLVFGALFLYAQTQRQIFASFNMQGLLPPILFDKARCAPLALTYIVSATIIAYVLLQKARAHPNVRRLTNWLVVMGRMSLYCFVVHLIVALGSRFYDTWSWPMAVQEPLTVASVGLVYVAAYLWHRSHHTGPPILRIVDGRKAGCARRLVQRVGRMSA